jgi:hypothetical protein
MITPRLTALMVAMSVLGTGGPIAALAQADAGNSANQIIGVETGRNTQSNSAVVGQSAENEIEISSDADSEADSEAKSESDGDKSESEAESEADSEADAETSVEDSVVAATNDQDATVNQANVLDDQDDVTVTATQVPVQTGIAVDADIEELLVLLGLDGA